MKHHCMRVSVLLAAALFLSVTVLEMTAHARAGGGRTSGSRGSRSYSRPAAPPSQSIPPRQQAAPATAPTPGPFSQPQPAGGGFFRNMAGGVLGGIAGGLLGGMLFRSLGFAGGGLGGSGFGLFEIILLAGIGYFIFRMIKGRRQTDTDRLHPAGGYQGRASDGFPSSAPAGDSYGSAHQGGGSDLAAGIGHIRQMDAGFDEGRFCDQTMDLFFKVQGGWMNRDLTAVAPLLTDEMRQIFKNDLDTMLRDRRTNRLENIAVRNIEIAEAWQESGQDFITVLIYANLLDYTTDDVSGEVVAGSKTEPVKFEEYWTVTRPVGPNPWKLSAIEQK